MSRAKHGGMGDRDRSRDRGSALRWAAKLADDRERVPGARQRAEDKRARRRERNLRNQQREAFGRG